MKWRGRRQSNNIEDRRGSGVAKTGGVGLVGIIIALILWGVFGIDPRTTLGVAEQISPSTATVSSEQTPAQQETATFVATVLADTEDVWTPIFASQGLSYKAPTLVLFTGRVQSACGQASSASGPFYCPADQKIYLDTQFFADMKRQMGITGEISQSSELSQSNQAGDFAQAYVIAHEVGHHVQTLLGISPQVRQAQAQASSQAAANELSVRQELQADCFAGLWARHNHNRTQFLQAGDIEEALDAAEKIGDDYLQQQSRGHVVPDSFTHGTSEQRKRWFYKGFETGNVANCDTFGVRQL